MWAKRARCHGGSWWCKTAGRPARTAATTREAGRFSGIDSRFSTTTRSTPAERAANFAVSRGDAVLDGEAGHGTSTGPVTRYGPHGETELGERPLPGGGHHGHSVRRSQPERHDRATGHAVLRTLAMIERWDARCEWAAPAGAVDARGPLGARRVHGAERPGLSLAMAVGLVLPHADLGRARRRRASDARGRARRCRCRTNRASCRT